MSMTAAKMLMFLDSLPQDIAAQVVFAGLSLSTEKLAKAVELAVALNAIRVLEEEDRRAGEKARVIVENTMADFQSKLTTSGVK